MGTTIRPRSLVSGKRRQVVERMSLRGVRHVEPLARRAAPVVPPANNRSGAFWTGAAVTHDRTVARLSIARTRQVTVTKVICGVDVSSLSLEAFVGPAGPARGFPNTGEGIAELLAFCREQSVELVAVEASGGYERPAFAVLWAHGVAVGGRPPPAASRLFPRPGWVEEKHQIAPLADDPA